MLRAGGRDCKHHTINFGDMGGMSKERLNKVNREYGVPLATSPEHRRWASPST